MPDSDDVSFEDLFGSDDATVEKNLSKTHVDVIEPPEVTSDGLDETFSLEQLSELSDSTGTSHKFKGFKSAKTPQEQLSEFLGFDEARIATLKSKGEIGAGENAKRNIDVLMGDAAAATIGSVGIQGDTRGSTNPGIGGLPLRIIKSIIGASDGNEEGRPDFLKSPTLKLSRVYNATKRVQANEYGEGEEELQNRDMDSIIDYMIKIEEERIRGTTIGGDVAVGLLALPEFILSFIATGGLGALTKRAVTRGLIGLVRGKTTKLAKMTLTNKIGRMTKKGLMRTAEIGVAGAVQGTAMVNLTAKSTLERQVGSNFEMTTKGIKLLQESNETPVTSLMKAWGDTMIEAASERSGRLIGKGLKLGIEKFIPKVFRDTMEAMFSKLNPLKNAKTLWSPHVYDGFLAEMGEEQLGDLMRAMTGLEDFGAGEDADMFDRMLASIHGGRELAVNAGIIAPLSGLGILAGIRKPGSGKHVRDAKETEAEGKNQVPTSKTLGEIIKANQARKEKEAEAKKKSMGLEEDVEKKDTKVKVGEEKEAVPQDKPVVDEAPKPKPQVDKVVREKEDKQKKLFKEGRVDEVNRRINTLNNKILAKGAAFDALIAEGKSTAKVETEMEAMQDRLEAMEQEVSDVTSGKIVATPGGKIRTVPSRVIAASNQKVREGIKFTEAEVKEVQKAAQKQFDRFVIEDKHKLKLEKKINKLRTHKDLEREGPTIERMFRKIEEDVAKKKHVTKITDLLKGIEGKTTKGKKLRGKFRGEAGAALQDRLNTIKKATELDKEEAFHKNEILLKKLDEGNFKNATEEAKIRLEISMNENVAGVKERSLPELENLLAEIQFVIAKGKTSTEAFIEAQKAQRELEQNLAVENIGHADNLKPRKEDVITKAKRFFGFIGDSMSGFDNLTAFISSTNPTQQKLDSNLKPTGKRENIQQTGDVLTTTESNLSKLTDTFEEEQLAKEAAMHLAQEYQKAGMKAYGLTEAQWQKKAQKDSSELVVDNIMIDESGKEVRVALTKAEIRKIVMEMRDPFIEENVSVEEGGYMIDTVKIDGISQEMKDRIFDNPEVVTNQDIAFVDAQLELYKDMYDVINPLYRELNGINLPRIDFYSPVQRVLTQEKEIETSFFDEQGFRQASDPSLLKTRVKNFNRLRVQSDISAMFKHIAELTHYTHMARKNRQLDNIFGNLKVRTPIIQQYGKGTMKLIDGFRKSFKDRGAKQAEVYDDILRGLRLNFTTAALGGPNVAAIPKQVTSFLAFMEHVPSEQFMAWVADFLANPVANWKTMRATGFGQTRSNSIDRDMQQLAKLLQNPKAAKLKSFNNMMMFFTKTGDFGGIVLGGWAMRKHLIDNGGWSVEKADRAWAKVASETQQSGDLSKQSAAQRGGEFMKLFTMFTTSQNALFRAEFEALRKVSADPQAFFKGEGRITHEAFAKKIAIYHFLIPSLFQFIANGFRWDSDDQLRAGFLGSFNGLFMFGDMLDNLTRIGVNATFDGDLDIFSESTGVSPVFGIMREIVQDVRKIASKKSDTEDVLDALMDLTADVAGPATGISADRIWNSFGGVDDLFKGDIEKGAKRLLGWTPYALGEGKKKKKPKKRRRVPGS